MRDQKLQHSYARRLDQACDGLSHREVGVLVGLPGETIRRYRKGMTAVPLHIASEICRRLDISPVWLVTGAGPRRSHEPMAAVLRMT